MKEYGWDKFVQFTLDRKKLMGKKEWEEFEGFLMDHYHVNNTDYIIDIHQISTNVVPDPELPPNCLLVSCRFREIGSEIK